MAAPAEATRRPRLGSYGAAALSLICHLLVAVLLSRLPAPRHADRDPREAPRRERVAISFVEPPEVPLPGPPAGAPDQPRRPTVPAPDPAPGGPSIPGPEPTEPLSEPGPAGAPSQATELHETAVEPAPPAAPADTGGPGNGGANPRPSLRRALREFHEPGGAGAGAGADVRGGGHVSFAPDLSQVPQTGFGVGNLTFESGDFDWTDYGRQIYWAILKAWYRRLWTGADDFQKWALATQGWFLDHRVRVRFVIGRTGQIDVVELEAGSGCPPLDLSAQDALREVILPPLPRDSPRGREVVHAQFIMIGEVRTLRESLVPYREWF